MRYWAYFAAKLVVAGGVLYGLLGLIDNFLPESGDDPLAPLARGGWVLAAYLVLMLWFLLAAAALYWIIRDQRYRCRVCLRRLRMPVETGSWGFMLQLGLPRIEYICPYGHGTLKQEELQASPLENPEWTRHSDDIWGELYASGKQSGDER